MNNRKVILVMDWLDAYAGSEQVVRYLHQFYKFDKVYTLTNQMPKINIQRIFGNTPIQIKTTQLHFFGRYFRVLLPFFPFFLKQLKVEEKNALIISVTHSVVKGVKFPADSIHIAYLVARNLKYVWEEKDLYFRGFKKWFTFIIPRLKKFDIAMSKRPTKIISVSDFVSNWSNEKYGRKVATINPPVHIKEFDFQEIKENFYVSVGRLEPYKRYDVMIETFNQSGKKLIIIGEGSLRKSLEKKANNNIEFKGYLFPNESTEYLKKATAFVFCGKEDFGIALLEAQVCGTPVVAYGAGGALDTVVEGKTGVFFKEQSTASLTAAIEKFETMSFNPHVIRSHSLRFSVDNFLEQFDEAVTAELLVADE